MEVSKLSFTRKTQEKMKQSLPVREKGKLLFARLKELEEDGTLSKAKTRADVARLAGYTEERSKAGYSWVSNLIRRGHLTETVREWTPSGKMVAEYHLTNTKPDYDYEEVKRRKAKKVRISDEWLKWQNHEVEAPTVKQASMNTTVKVELSKGDITIKVELAEVEQATNLITTIMKGE